MEILGIQKLTLLDYPGKLACTIFTGGCNLRCPFCHNASLVFKEGEAISQQEVLDFLKSRLGKLDGVAVTGGEPLINSDIVPFLEKVKKMGYLIKLDTNGTMPDALEYVVKNKLVDRVAMDVKSSPDGYSLAVGIENFDVSAVTRSKDFLMASGAEYEFRTTVVKGIHNVDQIVELAKWIEGAKEYYLQQFKDSGNLITPEGLDAFNKEEMEFLADVVRKYVPSVEIRGV